jgi:hypothetical protein
MSEQTLQILEAFDALPSDDKQTFVVEIMRRARELPFDSGPRGRHAVSVRGHARRVRGAGRLGLGDCGAARRPVRIQVTQ